MSQTSDTSQQTTPTCALGLTSADLSAWRDEALAPDETARIGAHSEGCPACQQRLQGFEAIAATLQAQQVPVPDERLWLAVFEALSTGERTTSDDPITGEYRVPDESDDRNPIPQSPTPPRSWRRRALGTLAAVAAIALVVVGFGRLFLFGAQNRPPQPFSLSWRQVALPGGMGATLDASASLSVFPADGSVAWLCQSGTKPAPGPLRVWRTSDGGATWKALPVAQIDKAFDCEITPDQLDPDVVALSYGYIPPKATTIQGDTLITFDGGASWHDAPFFNLITEFATLNGAIYAIRPDGTDANRLAVSRDGAQTWNYVDDAIHQQKLMPSRFWLNPNTGGLLVQAISITGDGETSLWTVDTSGNSWRSLTPPPTLANAIASPTTDGHWNICSMLASPNSDPKHRNIYPYHIYCGTEANSQWTTRPALGFMSSPGGTVATPCSGCIQVPSTIGATQQLAIANDGAVIVVFVNRFGTSGMPIGASLYRLPAGSSTWQNGGALPIGASTFGATQLGSTVIFTPRPGGGMLWAMPDHAHGSHAGPVFTASYPGPAAPPLPTQPQQTPTQNGNIDQAAPLEWQPVTNPNGFQSRLVATNILAIAPSDGDTAYACAQPNLNPPATQPLAWVTHNGGATWSSLALPQANGRCWLVVDEVNPRDVLLGISNNPPAGSPPLGDVYYRSVDGGATWQRMSGLDGSAIYQFASYHSAVYALRDTTPNSTTDYAHVQVSTDGMNSWKTIDGAFFSSHTSASQFWLNPYNGALIAANIPAPVDGIPLSTAATALVWHSGDGGAHWSSLGAPQLPAGGESSVFVQPPQANHTWGVCVANNAPSGSALVCSDDSSQTWRALPPPNIPQEMGQARYTAYTSDGAILAVSAAITNSGAMVYNVFRLPAGASRWQSLGSTPEYSLLYAPATGSAGMLWSVPINGALTDDQGRIFRVAAP